MGRWSQAFSAFYLHLTKQDSFVKGDDFEEFLSEYIFPKDKYKCIHRTPSEPDTAKRFIQSAGLPDFQLQDLTNGNKFWLEAKYSSKWYGAFPDQYILFVNEQTLDKYRNHDKDHTLFIAFGVGGSANYPAQTYIIPVRFIKYADKIYKKFLHHYEISSEYKDWKSADDPLPSQALWERLDNTSA